MIFNESYDLLQENGDEKKKPSGIVIAAEIIATIIIIIVTVILLVPTMIVVGIIGSVGGGLTNKEKAILKELNKHPKAKQLIVKAAKKMQDLLKKNIKSDFVTYLNISESSIGSSDNMNYPDYDTKNINVLGISLAYIDVQKLIKYANNGKPYEVLIDQGFDDMDIIYDNKKFKKEYFYIINTIEAIRKKIKEYPNNVVIDLYVNDYYDTGDLAEISKIDIGMEIRFVDYESLEKTPEIAKLKEAFSDFFDSISILNEIMHL